MEKTTLIKKIRINTTIELLTGTHIGGSKDNVEIGGIDNPVIKLATRNNEPYLPGSSIKGKMRCLLEQMAGSPKVGGSEEINRLFGSADANHPSPSRLIVRDATLTPESSRMLRECHMDMPYTECKYENVIDRVKGTAEHPRQTERVPAGAIFNVEMIVNVWNCDDEAELMSLLRKGKTALENDYIGGSGSRGYGQIRFGDWKETPLSNENNWTDKQ
ncbi:MAG: type III-A CRISPR-associated RAMP protein Csm3 [Bacteroidaceae bacterium]|nr:type III-A CRISPR-associated RAMP protein Csm3 [Bacteroidales bacterium]MCF0185161.1 type III-A CRISPR-associated RAMP protein Csm3 [Bacteroidaceae bacterium]